MTDAELNKLLHENVMGECWHEYNGRHPKTREFHGPSPDYCNSLDAVSRVEERVIEEAGKAAWTVEVLRYIGWQPIYSSVEIAFMSACLTARQRAEICQRTWEVAHGG